jgi:hypothetical protein
MRAALLALAVVLPLAAPASASTCLTADGVENVAGQLVVRSVDKREVLMLRLAAPICLSGPARADNVVSSQLIHIYSNVAGMARALKRLSGRLVQVRGRPFGAISVYHRAPIVMEVVDVDQS